MVWDYTRSYLGQLRQCVSMLGGFMSNHVISSKADPSKLSKTGGYILMDFWNRTVFKLIPEQCIWKRRS